MGIPGMHGIAVVLDEEEFLKLLIWMKKRSGMCCGLQVMINNAVM